MGLQRELQIGRESKGRRLNTRIMKTNCAYFKLWVGPDYHHFRDFIKCYCMAFAKKIAWSAEWDELYIQKCHDV